MKMSVVTITSTKNQLTLRQADADHYACAWSKDLENGTPLLCVAGGNGKIKIIDALSGELLRV